MVWGEGVGGGLTVPVVFREIRDADADAVEIVSTTPRPVNTPSPGKAGRGVGTYPSTVHAIHPTKKYTNPLRSNLITATTGLSSFVRGSGPYTVSPRELT